VPQIILAAASSGGSPYSSLILLVVLGAVFYFLLIRPQRRRQSQHQRLVEGVKVGDEVVTIGGLYGIVQFVGEQDFQLEIAPDTTVRMLKTAIARVVTADDEEEADDYDEDDNDDEVAGDEHAENDEAVTHNEDTEASGEERR
jgi:preprotein translocase subunit YajC